MTSSPKTIQGSTTLVEAARMMRDEDTGILPIVEGDRLTAVLTDRDIVVRAVGESRDPGSTTAGETASGSLVTIGPDQTLDEALRLMAQHQVRRLPVVEEDGRLAGMLAQADVAQAGHDTLTGEVVEKISR
jgi:CBS domain-containing protein